jgi:peptidoglycan/LPS O-acetylase OafA/YrhL
MTTTKNKSSEWAALGVVRLMLAIIVVASHYSLYVRVDRFHIFGAGYLNPLSAVFGFMLLSGYSISNSLERNRKRFLKRRVLRIFPLYYAALIFTLLLCRMIGNGVVAPLGRQFNLPQPAEIFASFFMAQNFLAPAIPFIGVIWSLSAEWCCYIVAPCLGKFSSKIIFLFAVSSFVWFLRANPAAPFGVVAGIDQLQHGLAFFAIFWFWLVGFFYHRTRDTQVGILLLLGPALFAISIGHSTGAPYLIVAFILIFVQRFKLTPIQEKIGNLAGDYSYPLYLFHFPSLILGLHAGLHTSVKLIPVMFLIPLVALYGIDRPIRKYAKLERSIHGQGSNG